MKKLTNRLERDILTAKLDLTNAENQLIRAARIGSDLMARLADRQRKDAMATLEELITPLVADLAEQILANRRKADILSVEELVNDHAITSLYDKENALFCDMEHKRLNRTLSVPLIQLVLRLD